MFIPRAAGLSGTLLLLSRRPAGLPGRHKATAQTAHPSQASCRPEPCGCGWSPWGHACSAASPGLPDALCWVAPAGPQCSCAPVLGLSASVRVPARGALFLSVVKAVEGHCTQHAHLALRCLSLVTAIAWVGSPARNTGRPAEADPLQKVGRYLEHGAAPWPPYDHRTPRKAPQHAGNQSALSLCGARCCVPPPGPRRPPRP